MIVDKILNAMYTTSMQWLSIPALPTGYFELQDASQDSAHAILWVLGTRRKSLQVPSKRLVLEPASSEQQGLICQRPYQEKLRIVFG